MNQHEITVEISNHPVLGSGKLSGGFTLNLQGHGPGISFTYFNGLPKRVFLKCDTNPSIKNIYDQMIEKESKTAYVFGGSKKLKRKKSPFGWCNRCESYCYGDCQA